jgi:phosphatidylglycerophosphate synthase
METIANYYSEILTSDPLRAILLVMGIYSTYPYFEEGGREILKKYFQKYKVLFLLFYGAVFFLSIAPEPRFFGGLKNPEIWYLWYAILIFTIFAIWEAFKSIWKRFIKYIIRKVKEDNK